MEVWIEIARDRDSFVSVLDDKNISLALETQRDRCIVFSDKEQINLSTTRRMGLDKVEEGRVERIVTHPPLHFRLTNIEDVKTEGQGLPVKITITE